jgi:hypothetical protein
LVTKIRRTENTETLDFAPVKKFTYNQQCLNGFPYTHIIGNKKAYWLKP